MLAIFKTVPASSGEKTMDADAARLGGADHPEGRGTGRRRGRGSLISGQAGWAVAVQDAPVGVFAFPVQPARLPVAEEDLVAARTSTVGAGCPLFPLISICNRTTGHNPVVVGFLAFFNWTPGFHGVRLRNARSAHFMGLGLVVRL